MTTTARHLRLVVGLAVAASLLAACSGADDHPVGEAVEVDFYPDTGGAAIASGTVTVTDIRDGSTADLEEAGFGLDPGESSATAYYVDVAYANDGSEPVSPRSVGAEDPDGALISALTIIDLGGDPFEPCAGLPEEVAPGSEAEGCTIILVPEEREAERLYYHPGGDDDFVYWALD